jgi:hypothetical protein
VIALEQGMALRDAGVRWCPADGDHFAIPDRDLDDRVFVLSHMVVEVIDSPVGPLLAFNGTTEWALDSIEVDEVVWLPLEHQLRELLGPAFLSLETVPGVVPATDGYAVTVRLSDGRLQRHVDVSADLAYTRAVLSLATRP